MIAILDRLAGRRQQRTGNAHDTLAAAARDAAAGKAVDVVSIDAALHELHQPVEFFSQLCDVAERRQTAGLALEKLGVATGKARKAAEAIESETRRYEESRKAYLSRLAALETEKANLDRTIEEANRARATLLQPENVLGSVRREYEAALAERDTATSEADRLRREVKQQRDRIAEADRWIKSIRHAHGHEIKVSLPVGQPTASAKEAREVEPHELAKGRARRRIEEIEPELREAEDRLDRAERAVVAIELAILKQ